MGMYTELHFNAILKKDTPQEIIDVLLFMLMDEEEQEKQDKTKLEIPNHPLFETERWSWMLIHDSCSFPFKASSSLEFDEMYSQYFLAVHCSLKNYNGEIKKFIDWINPYIDADPNTFLGFRRLEGVDDPTHIRKRKE